LAFETIPGAGQIDFIGTDEVDVLVAVNIEEPSLVEGKKADDSITYLQFATGVTRAATVRAGEGNDTVVTNAGAFDASQINGNQGDDTFNLIGTVLSNTVVRGGDNNDVFTTPGQLVSSTINGNKGADTLVVGGAGLTTPVANSLVAGGKDNDTITVNGLGPISNTVFNGNDGTDTITLTGYGFGSTVPALLTNVTFFGGQGGDTITALGAFNGAGTEGFFLSGDKGNDNVTGSAGDDTILLGEGNDTGVGGAGKDTMRGGAGDDTLTGDAGTNVIVGGEGADTYVAGAAAGTDNFVIEAISNSAATTSGATQRFDTFGPVVGGIDSFDTGIDTLDLKAVASTLAGGAVNNLTGVFTNAVAVATAANFGALKAALDAAGIAGSTTGTIQITNVTVGAGALAGTYLWINDNQSAYNTGDLMFKTNAAGQIAGTDIVLV
jgi:Ca2+-binding RTX toxin-like protein